jgi:VIT1/CCC1 family predicted Fe2+/Mn2+ transporter
MHAKFMQQIANSEIELRDVILGGQDGLVNVLGLSLGLFASHSDVHVIIVAGLAAGFSEAVSMGAVAYTSSIADKERVKKHSTGELVFSSAVVGLSALVGALIPVIPFLLFGEGAALLTALVISALILFGLGALNAKQMGNSEIRGGMQILIIGLVSAFAGFLIGLALKA